jgi:hypothetical protein
VGDDLVEFLRDRLDEDERQARAAMIYQDANWRVEISGIITTSAETDVYTDDRELAEHIARHDPARVLADVEAKREIVEQHALVGDGAVCLSYCHTRTPGEAQPWPCLTLRLLALPYVDHPEYQEEWKPQQLYRAGRPGVIDYRDEPRP